MQQPPKGSKRIQKPGKIGGSIIILSSWNHSMFFFFPVALLLMLSLGAVETPQISRWRFRAGLFHRHRGTMKTNDIAMKALSLGGLKRYHHESRVYHVCWHHYLIQARVGKIDEHGTLLTCLLQPFLISTLYMVATFFFLGNRYNVGPVSYDCWFSFTAWIHMNTNLLYMYVYNCI